MNKDKLVATCVFYITSDCNLKCEYCYERIGRPNKSMTKEEIDNKLKWVDKNLADNSHIVIFGGEPLLRIDLIEYIIDKLIITYKDRYFSISMDTNSILLLDDNIFERYKSIVSKRQFTTFISYDGPNSFRRKDANGNCINDKIIEVFKKLEKNGLEYGISYTWHKENDKNIIRDMIYIYENFNPLRIVISPNFNEISKYCSGDLNYEAYIKTYIPYFETIFLEYKKPICDFTCKICKKCMHNNNNVYQVPQKNPIVVPKKTNHSFNLWD